MRKLILYILVSILLPLFVNAQQNDDNAFAGRKNIFIYHGYEPASPAYPDANGNTGFILQRHDKGINSPWVTISNFHSPQSAGELFDNYAIAIKNFPDNKDRFDAAAAWAKWKRYKTYDSLQNELAFAPGQIAFGILAIDSTTKTAGNTYQYRILKNKDTAQPNPNNVSNWVPFPAIIKSPAPKYLHRRTERDATILQWYIHPGFSTGGFNVYRATGNEKQFHLISLPVSSTLSNDTLIYTVMDNKLSSTVMYRYYITLVNAFGGGGNIKSDTISATLMDPKKLLPPQYLRTNPDAKKRAIAIHYSLHDRGLIGSVHIMRSESFNSDYKEIGINSSADTLYNDYRITPGKKYYYYLVMTDKMGRNSARSIKTFGLFQDNTNFFPARYVTAMPVAGGVKILWQNAPDTSVISGYYVCRSTGTKGQFKRITTLLPVKAVNSYTDTSKNLQPATLYGYSVVSENLSNIISQNSVIAYVTIVGSAVNKPLTIPKNVKAIAENNFVRLLWYDMRVLNSNQAYYNIYRRSDKDTVFKKISSNYPAFFTSYLDTTTVAGYKYSYSIECADATGHTSAQAYTNSVNLIAPIVKAPDITGFATTQTITIMWEPIFDKYINQYIIYRYIRGETPKKIGVAKNGDRTFVDKTVTAGKMYYYYLMPDSGSEPLTTVQSNLIYASLKSN